MLKILQSLESALYEVALWLVLIPKTLVKVIIDPKWINRYVRSELEKDDSIKYESFISPITLFVLVGVLPLLASRSDPYLNSMGHEFVAKFYKLPFESQILAMVLFYVAYPLGFSVLILLWKHQPINRTSMRPIFYAQCMVFTFLYFLLFLVSLLSKTLRNNHLVLQPFAALPILLAPFWYFYMEACVVSEELSTTKRRGLGIVIICHFLAVFLMILIGAVLVYVISAAD